MPTCSSSVARARRSLREGGMTTQALDANAILPVAGTALVSRRATARRRGLRHSPSCSPGSAPRFCGTGLRRSPSAAQSEEASCGRARAQDGSGSGARCRLRAPLAARNRNHGNPRTHVGHRLPAQEPAPLHEAQRRRVALPMRFAREHVEYRPLGVVGIVAPWNYPLSLALMPLATALAAGNRAMISPSELTPATSDALVALVAERLRGRGRHRHRRRIDWRQLCGAAFRSPLLPREHRGRPAVMRAASGIPCR